MNDITSGPVLSCGTTPRHHGFLSVDTSPQRCSVIISELRGPKRATWRANVDTRSAEVITATGDGILIDETMIG